MTSEGSSNEKIQSSLLFYKNFDPHEIIKFSAVATRCWDIEGEFKLLHRINPLRLDYILEHTNGLFGKKVLDIGCGGGILSESMAQEGAEVTGLDISIELLTIARKHAFKNSKILLEYHHQTVEEHAMEHLGIYDVITCMEILEHVPNPASIVRACAYLVKPGGNVFFSTINRNFKAWLIAIVGAEYILRIIPRKTHNIKKFIKPAELLKWIDKTFLYEQDITGLQYDPLRDHFYFSDNVDVNYILYTRCQTESD